MNHPSFPHRHAILPVIHVQDATQAVRDTGIALEAGCDGVFLFGGGTRAHLRSPMSVYDAVRSHFPTAWIGVWEGRVPGRDFPLSADGLWTDNAGIDETQEVQVRAAQDRLERRKARWRGLYFGGVAFKYQRPVPEALLPAACWAASPFMDFVTTTGPGTGYPPTREKIAIMREALGRHPLAISSGITPENVGTFLDLADAFLVATGIEARWGKLDPARVRALVDAVRSWRSGLDNR